jgi:predicted CXXCH cytochrome family protein
MRARWRAGLGAAALAVAGARAAGESTCELEGSIRAATSSRSCMACHDGSAAKPVPTGWRAFGPVTSHPVGIDYAQAAARHPATYTPASQLPPEVVLVGGKVECTTCHDGASTLPARVANTSGELCLACHRL